MIELVGADLAAELERLSRTVYAAGRDAAAERGLVLADTKFEFGRDAAGRVVLIDEVMTPDSSRYWPAQGWSIGEVPPSFDKQPLRDHLDAERAAGRWNGEAPPPPLPQAVIDAMSARYLDLYRRMTGDDLAV
jgi:phosphoribosylaminoimidazole-succinocarboxamide synthase